MTGIDAILETLNAQYSFDGRGRLQATRIDGILPRFVLGRAAEGCVWRFRAGLDEATVAALARLAGRESGASFEGELPAPPERVFALSRVLAGAGAGAGAGGSGAAPRRSAVTRAGVVRGELWLFD